MSCLSVFLLDEWVVARRFDSMYGTEHRESEVEPPLQAPCGTEYEQMYIFYCDQVKVNDFISHSVTVWIRLGVISAKKIDSLDEHVVGCNYAGPFRICS